ncbi:TPA: phage repressor protein CI [Vibrio parahaemolyticus]|uniref:phage repressor protein CI n=1 Tax=Vibrio TaxID=662 RepID=UPI000421F701|nr:MULTISPECIES: phage repressor protein CI [Vibrio]MDW3165396.1 phage repressor protein CI [Vibrio sp. Y184]
MNENKKILPYEYQKGRDFTDNLKKVLNCRNLEELSEILGVPKSTFTTWNAHDRTSHELMVRLHLAKGIPLEELALRPEDRNSDTQKKSDNYPSSERSINPQSNSVIIKSFCLTNGQLLETGEIPYPVRRMNSFGLDHSSVIEVETNEAIYLLDKSTKDAVSGKYLIDVDGRLSLNHVQRLPGKKLAIAFGDSTIEVSEHDIKVIGRVAVTLKKD